MALGWGEVAGGLTWGGWEGKGSEAWQVRQGWILDTLGGNLWQAGRFSRWEGQPARETRLKEGDVVVRLHLRP